MNEQELFGKSPEDRLRMLESMSLAELENRKLAMDELRDDLIKECAENSLSPEKRITLDLLCEDLEWEMKAAIRKAEAKAANLKKAA